MQGQEDDTEDAPIGFDGADEGQDSYDDGIDRRGVGFPAELEEDPGQVQGSVQDQASVQFQGVSAATNVSPSFLRPSLPRPSTSTRVPRQATLLPRSSMGLILTSPWQGDIDLSTKQGKALWDEGIKPVESKFSGLGKDLHRFLADVKNRINKCHWHSIVIVNGKSLIQSHGEVTLDQVKQARNDRKTAPLATLQDARPVINAEMMYHFIYESLGAVPQKKISTRLEEIELDGPTLLKIVLDDTFVGTKASTFIIMNQIYNLHPKTFRWSIKALNLEVKQKLTSLMSTGHRSQDDTQIIISLFKAYKECSNQDFKLNLTIWENEWKQGKWDTAEKLMELADSKYEELYESRCWGKKESRDEQIVALNAKIKELNDQKSKGSSSSGGNQDEQRNPKTPKWKYDESLSSTGKLKKNDKQYYWCKGPGHNGVPMWARHQPGTCTEDYKKKSGNKSKNKSPFSPEAMTAAFKEQGFSEDKICSKVEAIMSVIES